MKRLACIISFITFVCLQSFSKPTVHLFARKDSGTMHFVSIGKNNYCITGNTVYLAGKKGLIQKFTCSSSIADAAVCNSNIALATTGGIQLFNTKTNTATVLLPQLISGNINHILADVANHIWFTKEFEGCFMIDENNTVVQKIKVPVTYSLACTSDSNAWVGTNVGLYKVPISGKEIERYAEEGIASYDLPDNLVEQLFTDAQSNVWVVMPGHISFIAANEEEEFPDYEYLGKKDNALYNITAVKDLQQTYLFATAQGVLLMHGFTNKEELHTGEIHQTINEKAYLLTDNITEKPESLKEETIKIIRRCGEKTFFVTDKGLWSISTTQFVRRLKNSFKL